MIKRLCQFGGLVLTAVTLTIWLFLASFQAKASAQEQAVPEFPPDAEFGLLIYAERCAICHGATGAGDGQRALDAGLEPVAFSDAAYRQTAVPSAMFEIITNGSIPNGMPPFGGDVSDPIPEDERWDLVAAIYSFSTPAESIARGEAIVAEQGVDTVDWPGLDYWFTRSNEMALADLENGTVFGVDIAGMNQADKEAVIDYGRSLHYQYSDPLAAFAPIEAATISGNVENATTNEPFIEGTVRLRAFTTALQQTLSMTSTLGSDGRYHFDLEDVDPAWVYLASVEYNGLSFNSNAAQLTHGQTDLEMPVFVYEPTTNPAAIRIDRLHIIFDFAEGFVQVSELYVFSNQETAVFMGETGDPNEGTIEFILPAGATNFDFQRAFGSLENFGPALEIIQTETGWADTVPLRPGSAATSLLVTYNLPYEEELLLAHPLVYPAGGATLILPDVGVTVTGEEWVFQGIQALSGGPILTYDSADLTNADAISLTLNGRPQLLTNAAGETILVRDETTELIIGGLGLLLAVGAAVLLIRSWQTTPRITGNRKVDGLLQAIADLDDDYEAGQINERKYDRQRQKLKRDLTAVWSKNRD